MIEKPNRFIDLGKMAAFACVLGLGLLSAEKRFGLFPEVKFLVPAVISLVTGFASVK